MSSELSVISRPHVGHRAGSVTRQSVSPSRPVAASRIADAGLKATIRSGTCARGKGGTDSKNTSVGYHIRDRSGMARYRGYTNQTPVWTPAKPSYPDYERVFSASFVPPPPPVEYIPFDSPVILNDQVHPSVQLSTLRETLLYSTRRDARVQFVEQTYAQDYPGVPEVSYPEPPQHPGVTVVEEPTLPRRPELTDFLPARSLLTTRIPLLYGIQRLLARSGAVYKLNAARAAHDTAHCES
jgi:hypothetical protein